MRLKMDVYIDCGKKENKPATLCLKFQYKEWCQAPVADVAALASPNPLASQMEILAKLWLA